MSLLKGRFTIRGTGRFIITDKEPSGDSGSGPVDSPDPEPEVESPPDGYVNLTASFSSLSASSISLTIN